MATTTATCTCSCKPTFVLLTLTLGCILRGCLSLESMEHLTPKEAKQKRERAFQDRQPDAFHGDFGPEQFARFDSDKDGFITMDEGMSHLAEGEGIVKQVPKAKQRLILERLFESLDADKDGLISETEFLKNPIHQKRAGGGLKKANKMKVEL